MEIDVDPLKLSDPLDCKINMENKDDCEDDKWFAQLKPEEISIEDVPPEPEGEMKPVANSPLKRRKPRKLNPPEVKKGRFDSGRGRKNILGRKFKKDLIQRKSTSDGEKDSMTEGFDSHSKKCKSKMEKGIRVCEICKKTFATASHLEEHVSSHFRSRFPCRECGKLFSSLRNLQRHSSTGHDLDAHLKTDEIVEEKKLEEKEVLNESKGKSARAKNVGCKRKHRCEICQRTFISIGHLNAHVHRHSGKKWKCDGCGKNFSCERSLIRHKETFPGDHRFPCRFCGMNFFRLVNLVKHLEIKHPEASPEDPKNHRGESNPASDNEKVGENDGEKAAVVIRCQDCPKEFRNSESLKIHREAMHSPRNCKKSEEERVGEDWIGSDPVSNYKCDVCSKEFVSLEGFEYHRKNQHVENRPAKGRKRKGDDFCGETGEEEDPEEAKEISSPSLQAHVKAQSIAKNVEVKSGSHQCCICPRFFASSDGLKYHLATHTGERRHSCSQCGKKFIKKTHLVEHAATHSQVKYFKCLKCPRTFSTYSAYRKHVKRFPGPHSFPCTKCGKLFTKESMIEKHVCVDLVKVTMAPEVKALLSEEKAAVEECLGDSNKGGQRSGDFNGNPTWEESLENEIEGKMKENTSQDNEQSADSNSHSCYKCFKVYPSLSQLQAHQFDHIGKQQYQCRFCPENFKRADDFSSHIRNHLGSTPYMCLKCNRKFISPLTLSLHAKKYPGEHSFTCQKCQRWFPSENRLEKHECILQNADVFVCACGSPMKNWNEFVVHVGPKPYQCCSCDLKYLTLVALARHVKKHTGIKPFFCELCGKSFRAKNNYLHHRNGHEETKEIRCEHCEFKSKSQKRMNFHLFRKHSIGSNTSSTLCPICGIIFPYVTQMKKHVETEHGNDLILEGPKKEEKKSLPTVLCTLCGKLLSNKYMLANHTRKVHEPKAPKEDEEFECGICGEKFKSKKRLQRHSSVHEAPGLRICQICSKEFYFARDLRKHMRRHDTSKPYSCLKCGKNFKVSVSLKYHSSICGNANVRTSAASGGGNGIVGGEGSRGRRQEKISDENVYYSHIPQSLEPKNRSCSVLYRRWNP